jgi:hypothetical protein
MGNESSGGLKHEKEINIGVDYHHGSDGGLDGNTRQR